MTDSPAAEMHVLRIVRGEPSDEEVAALIAVVAALADAAAAEQHGPRSAWADPAHRLRTPLHPGPKPGAARRFPEHG